MSFIRRPLTYVKDRLVYGECVFNYFDHGFIRGPYQLIHCFLELDSVPGTWYYIDVKEEDLDFISPFFEAMVD